MKVNRLRRRTFNQTTLLAGAALLAARNAAAAQVPKVLLVVAHPDDEYECAATIYRIARELGGIVDQVVISNGEAGYRYSALAEAIYGVPLTDEAVGRARLPEIRRREVLNAGRILGIRNHHFLNERDPAYTLDPNEVLQAGGWNRAKIVTALTGLLHEQRYDFVITLLPTQKTHGHHQAASLLTLEAIHGLPVEHRPVALGALAASAGDPAVEFTGRSGFPVLNIARDAPVFEVNRLDRFGFREALDYSIVVNWVIAEHKSQGLFQTEYGKHTRERFWVFETSPRASAAAASFFARLANRERAAHR